MTIELTIVKVIMDEGKEYYWPQKRTNDSTEGSTLGNIGLARSMRRKETKYNLSIIIS